MTIDLRQFRVQPGQAFSLDSVSPQPPGSGDGAQVASTTEDDCERMVELHKRLRASEQAGILVVLMAVDTGGKDPTIGHVFAHLDLRGTSVVKFGEPSETDQLHDFLWRAHAAVPGRGEIVVFNRSHYDDITEPWIREGLDPETRQMRYEHIRNFEKLLVDSDIVVLKLHFRISRDEQARRVLGRIDNPDEQHEFDPHDIEVQHHWDTYQTAFEEIINETTTDWAPWYVVPANDDAFRDAVVARLMVETLERLKPEYPRAEDDLSQYRDELEEILRQ